MPTRILENPPITDGTVPFRPWDRPVPCPVRGPGRARDPRVHPPTGGSRPLMWYHAPPEILAMAPVPSIYEYLDYRAYLRDWLQFRDGHPSARALARRLKCSPSMLSSVMAGTRDLARPLAERLADGMALVQEERAYFLDLVAFEQAETRAQRSQAMERVMATRRYRTAARVADGAWLVFTRWYYAAIVELSRCVGFREDPEWIANTLRPPVTVTEAAEAIDALLAAGILARNEAGVIAPAAEIWATDHHVARLASAGVAELHKWVLARAAESLDTLPGSQRHVTTVSLSVSAPLLAEIKRMVSRFNEEVIGRTVAWEGPRDRVVQLSIQVLPVTASTIEGEDAPSRPPPG